MMEIQLSKQRKGSHYTISLKCVLDMNELICIDMNLYQVFELKLRNVVLSNFGQIKHAAS